MTRIAQTITTCWIAWALLLVAGCGETPRAADSAQARTALQAALDAGRPARVRWTWPKGRLRFTSGTLTGKAVSGWSATTLALKVGASATT